MRPPIILIDDGDISVFPSVEAAARYMEPIGVRTGDDAAYDSTGRRLRLVATEPLVTISGYDPNLPLTQDLDRALRSFAIAATGAPVSQELATLDQLLAYFIDRFGYTA